MNSRVAWLGHWVVAACVWLSAGAGLAQSAPEPPSLRAVKRQGVIRIDGLLDEPDWGRAPVGTDFIERTPVPDRKPEVETQVRVLYDTEALYVGVRLALKPGERPRALQMERDSFSIWSDEALTLKFDVRGDKRTTVGFVLNPAGAQLDYIALENGAVFRAEYDAVWESETTLTDEAWYAEFRLPIAALGIPSGEGERVMGFNVARDYNAAAHVYYWAPIPPELSTTAASRYGELHGIRDIGGGRPLVLQPYALARYERDPTSADPNAWSGKAGGNISMRLAEDTWGELTVLTDFAEVDADDVVINLSRFPIFLPEKRPFFLSGLDVFEFGRASKSQLFFSRRIGLSEDIYGGAKIYGRSGDLAFGVLNVVTEAGELSAPSLDEDGEEVPQAPAAPASNWGVARTRYSFGRNGHVGGLFATRQTLHDPNPGGSLSRSHYSAGLDATLRSDDARWELASFGATTITPADGELDAAGLRSYGDSAGTRLDWKGQRFQPYGSVLYVSPDFNPEVGLVRRRNAAEYEGSLPWIERGLLGLEDMTTRFTSKAVQTVTDGELAGHQHDLSHRWQWPSKWRVELKGTVENDRVPVAFRVADRVDIQPGDYTFGVGRVQLATPYVRNPNLTLTYDTGTFYGAARHGFDADLAVSLTRHFRLTGRAVIVRLGFPGQAAFTTTAINARVVAAATPNLLMSMVGQFNSVTEEWSGQARLRWRYWPGSDLIAVYQERLFTGQGKGLGQAQSLYRSITLKLNHRFDALL